VGRWGDPVLAQAAADAWDVAADAPLSELAGALGPLVDQLAQVGSGLRAAQDAAKWSGPAADAFRATAAHRATQISSLMHRVQQAAQAAKAASEILF
jgi:hypothetical protein